jgi:hypothetical protein
MRSSIGGIQKASMDLMAHIGRAIDIGQTLPSPAAPSPEIDRLIRMLSDARNEAGLAPSTPVGAPPCRDLGGWLHLAALALHDLNNRTRRRADSVWTSMCEFDHSSPSELRFPCNAIDRPDLSACVRTIELALAMTNGSVRLEHDQLIITWDAKKSPLSSDSLMS